MCSCYFCEEGYVLKRKTIDMKNYLKCFHKRNGSVTKIAMDNLISMIEIFLNFVCEIKNETKIVKTTPKNFSTKAIILGKQRNEDITFFVCLLQQIA